jgi:hypothetical protein
MKISIDGILGTAQKINKQKEQEDNNLEKQKSGVKVDSVTIGGRINNRLDAIETEFREVQSSLTESSSCATIFPETAVTSSKFYKTLPMTVRKYLTRLSANR